MFYLLPCDRSDLPFVCHTMNGNKKKQLLLYFYENSELQKAAIIWRKDGNQDNSGRNGQNPA